MTICAYCQQDRQATREHIIPSFIYAFQKELEQSVTGWNEVANKMIKGEAKIKDVCAECNNGVLGQLDSYGKQFLSESGLLVQNYTKISLSLKYDYSLLLRWLLKVSFNSSRTDGVQSSVFKEHVPYILGLDPPPPRYRVAILVYLSAPVIIENDSSFPQSFIAIAQGSSRLNPFLVRLGYGGVSNDRYIHRINVLGPAVFQLVLFNDGILPGHAAAEIRSIVKAQPGAVELNQKRGQVLLSAGKQTWFDLYGPQIIRTRAAANGSLEKNNWSKPSPPRG